MTSRFSHLAAVIACVAAVHGAQAQQATYCTAEQLPNSRHSGTKLPSGQYNDFWGGGISVRCPAKGIVLKADSAEMYGDEKRIFLVGNVDYREPRLTLVSNFLTYFLAQERVVAVGNVHARLPSGSSLEGPQAEFLRAAPKIRPRQQMTAIGRPTVALVQKDSAGRPDLPTMVVANTLFMDGDSLVYAGGQVQITRTEFAAKGDSAFIDSGLETMRLMRNPSVEGKREDHAFKLVGDVIDMYSKQRKLQRVLSRAHAVATSRDLALRSDTIDLRVTNDMLQHASAWGTSRARATSPTQDMLADSIDVEMPNQRVREVRSYRKAFAEGKPDTTKFRIPPGDPDSTDWLRGDTILAHFDTLPAATPPDTSKAPAIRQLQAMSNASSLYHMPPQDSCVHKPAISYVKGHLITVDFANRQVATVTVDGRNATNTGVSGVLIEPVADSASACGPKTKKSVPAKAGPTSPAKPASPVPTPGRRPPPQEIPHP